jgi:DNA-binding transcriptional ArsR family regulator
MAWQEVGRMIGTTPLETPVCGGTEAEAPCPCEAAAVIDLLLGADDVASIRFGPDPVWETVASLGVLAHPGQHQLHRGLLERARRPGWDHDLLMSLMSSPRWYPAFLAPAPRAGVDDARASLASLAETSEDVAAADLETLRRTQPDRRRWERTTPAQLVGETAAALTSYWSAVLHPLWERVNDINNADISYRSRTLASEGVGATLAGLHERMSYREGRLRLEMPGHHEHRQVGGSGVRFVPSVFRWPRIVAGLDSAPPVVSYAARGSGRLWESNGGHEPAGLDPVLGRSRVAILTNLDAPSTTTRLARLLRLSNGTVSEHLTAMQRAGLLQSSRRGREVLYERTDLGHALIVPQR